MYQKLSDNMQVCIDTDNKQGAIDAYSEARDAWMAEAITHEEFAEIRGDFAEAFPDIL